MKNYTQSLLIILFFGFLTGCQSNTAVQQPELTFEQRYENSVKDAMYADANEISNNLVAITPSNTKLSWQSSPNSTEKRVLVVSWTKFPQSFRVNDTIQTTWGQTWVTTFPEVKDFFKANYPTNLTIEQRAEQLLGLPIGQNYTHFVEMWVKPEDLFRPTPDKEITDTKAELTFPTGTDDAHKQWINDNIIFSYYPSRYPWTRLGYTYDWGNPQSEIGMSEFILRKNSKVIVKSLTPNAAYLVK
jgi:hypothetical protein